jgi:hypothetical protein
MKVGILLNIIILSVIQLNVNMLGGVVLLRFPERLAFMKRVIMLSIIMLSLSMLSVIMLSVSMLSVIMPSVD